MRIFRLIAASLFLAAIATLPAYGQGTARPTSPAQTGGSAIIGEAKIAIIDTGAFFDQKQGIGRFTILLTNLNREFQPRQTELDGMRTRIAQLTDEISKQQGAGVVDQKSLQAKADQLDQLKKDYQRKGEDATAAYNKRRQEIFGPLQEDIGKQIEAFAKQRGISIIIDAAQVPLLYAADSIDITRAFIQEYNSKNPATASTAAPGR
ncbi:MAG TPA: OmpH family outer membrane protein [Pyrinomonadaceae bacterium]|jgi:outer membrane protein|nr:OmpH family outer membrane protein [Pyrinomonadaceae bacterium]